MNLTIIFVHNFNYCIYFSTVWAENAQTYSWCQLDINFAPYDLPKNISNKTTLWGRFVILAPELIGHRNLCQC